MSIHTFTGLNLQLAGQPRQFDMGNLVHRRAAALAIQSVDGASFSNELITGLNQRPGTLTPELREEFERITSTNSQFPDALVNAFESLMMREPAVNGIQFVEPQLSMEDFLRACGIAPKEQLPGITEGSARVWGSYQGQETKSFREPRSLSIAQAVALHADAVAIGEGSRVDPLEFAGHIYPELRVMLEEATQTKNDVYVKPPAFMAHLPFREHTFQKFASALANSSLAKQMGEDVGVAIARLQTYVSDSSAKIMPYVSTLREISRAIAVDALANPDGQYAKEVFRYLIVLRLRDYLTVEEGGKLRSLVPIYENGLPAIYTTSRNVASRYTIIVKPDMRDLHGSDEAAKQGRRRRWIDRIMSSHYDQRVTEWEQRLASFDAFEDIATTHHDGTHVDLHSLRIELGRFRLRHNAYKSRLQAANGAHDAMTHDEVAEVAQFYGTFASAYGHAMFFTHVRGEIRRDGSSISYEIVAQPNARSAARIPSGFAPVYGGDVFAQDWSPRRQEAVVTLRAIRGYLARTGQLAGSEARFAEEVLVFYWPGRMASDFRQALEDLRTLGRQDLFVVNAGVALPLTSRSLQETALQPDFFLHDAGYARAIPKQGETKLQAMVRHFYDRAGWGSFAADDALVVQQYLNAVRHPHYVYDSDLLARFIAEANATAPAQSAARSRIEKLFGAYSIKNDEAHKREQAGQGKVTARTLSDQAFTDYRTYFSPLVSHGLELPTEEDLVSQIAQGLVAQHPSVKVAPWRVAKALHAAIRNYNRALCRDSRLLPEHNLLGRGLFDVRFGRFVDAWLRRSGSAELPLDRRTLISAAQSLMSMANGVEDIMPAVIDEAVSRVSGGASADQVAGATSFLTSWIKGQRRDANLMDNMLNDAAYGIEAFMANDGQRYRSPVIPTSDFALLAGRAVRRRLSRSGTINGRAEALDVLNDRFEFLPQVREQAARFMQAAVAHYLAWLRTSLRGQLGNMVEALELMADGEQNLISHDDFVRDLADIADASVPLDIFRGAYPSLRAVERVHRVAGELSTGSMPPAVSVSQGVASIVRRNRELARKEQEEMDALKAEVWAKVKRAQAALARGRREATEMIRKVSELMFAQAARVADELAALSTRIPGGSPSLRSSTALLRHGRIAHQGAAIAAQQLDRHGIAVSLVSNLHVRVIDSSGELEPLRHRFAGQGDQLLSLGGRFEEASVAIGAEQDRRAREAADNQARAATVLAAEEKQRLENLISPTTFVERLNRLMTQLGGVESSHDDQQSYIAARAAHAADRREARQVVNFIDRGLAIIVRGTESERSPSHVIAHVRSVARQADQMRERTDASAEEVMDVWGRVKDHATELSGMRDRVNAALETARHRLVNAERSLPAATVVDMTGINRVVGRVRSVAGRDDAQFTLYLAKPLSKKGASRAKEALDGHARLTSVLSVGNRGYLVVMDDTNRRSFNAWRDGGRRGQLMLASIDGRDVVVPEGLFPVYTTPISALPESHPLGRMAAHFAALKDNRGPARAFVAWVDQQRRDGNVVAMQVWDHIVARLADPELQTEDVPSAIADVAAVMSQDLHAIDPNLRWVDVVTEYEPVTRPMFADERRQLFRKNSSEIDGNMIARVGGRRAVVHAMSDFVNAVEHTAMPKDPTRLHLWRALFKSSKGPVVRGIASAAAAWALIGRAERNKHPHAGTLRRRLLNSLKSAMFPKGIEPNPDSMIVDAYTNDIARASEEFYIQLYTELEHPRLIHDASLGYGVARHQSIGGSVANAMGFAESTLASQLISTIFEHNCYLPSGYALWRVFGNDGSSRELRDAVQVIFRRYGAYTLDESEPLSIHWMLEEMQDVLSTVERVRNEDRPLPAWWTTAPDSVLAGLVPETARVSWWRIDHTVRLDDSRDPRAPIHNAAHRFVQLFPEFAGAVTIIETVRDAIGGLRDYPFIQKITTLYSQAQKDASAGTLDGQRAAIAATFRKIYLSKLPFVRAVLTKDIQGRESLSRMLRIYDAIPSDVDAAGSAGAVDTLIARRGAGVNPLHKPSK